MARTTMNEQHISSSLDISILSADRKELAELMAAEMMLSKKGLSWDRIEHRATNPVLQKRIRAKRNYSSFAGSAMNLLVGKGEPRVVFMKYRAWVWKQMVKEAKNEADDASAGSTSTSSSDSPTIWTPPVNTLYSWKAHYKYTVQGYLNSTASRHKDTSDCLVQWAKQARWEEREAIPNLTDSLLDIFLDEQDRVYHLQSACVKIANNRRLDFHLQELQQYIKSFLHRIDVFFQGVCRKPPSAVWEMNHHDMWILHYRSIESIMTMHLEGLDNDVLDVKQVGKREV